MSLCVDAQPFSLGSNQHMHSLCDHICPIALLPLPLLSPCNDCAPLAASGALLTRWAGGLRCCRACTSRSHTRSSRSLWRTHPPSTTAVDGGCVPLLMRGAWQVCLQCSRRQGRNPHGHAEGLAASHAEGPAAAGLRSACWPGTEGAATVAAHHCSLRDGIEFEHDMHLVAFYCWMFA